MKRVRPDIGETIFKEYIGNLKSVRKISRLWGSEVIDEIEVLTHRQYYHTVELRSPTFESLFKFLSAYDDVTSANYKGVDSAWLYFNKNKKADLPEEEKSGFIASNLNKIYDNGVENAPENFFLTTSIIIETENPQLSEEDSIIASTLISESMTKEEIKTSIEQNYDQIWELLPIKHEDTVVINKGSNFDQTNKIEVQNEDVLDSNDIWGNVLARNAIKSGVPFEITNISKGISQGLSNTSTGSSIKSTVVVDLKIPYLEALETSNITNDIKNYLNTDDSNLSLNSLYTKNTIKKLQTPDIPLQDSTVARNYDFWENSATSVEAKFESIWVNTSKGWCIRYDAVRFPQNYNIKLVDMNNYILSIIDSDYKKKKVPWYKKAIAVILFVVAIVLIVKSGGKSLKLLTVAKAIIGASLILTVLTLALSAVGLNEWASAFAEASKIVDPLVTIASIIVLVDLASSFADKVAEQGLTAIGDTAKDFAQDLVDEIMQGATDLLSGTVSSASIKFTSTIINMYTMPDKNKLKSLNSKNKDLKAEYDKLSEELDQERDALRGFMNIYAKPATADWSIYATQFDMPYEAGGGMLSTGNIQRTTKQALRKAEYNEPIFDNIRIKY